MSFVNLWSRTSSVNISGTLFFNVLSLRMSVTVAFSVALNAALDANALIRSSTAATAIDRKPSLSFNFMTAASTGSSMFIAVESKGRLFVLWKTPRVIILASLFGVLNNNMVQSGGPYACLILRVSVNHVVMVSACGETWISNRRNRVHLRLKEVALMDQ